MKKLLSLVLALAMMLGCTSAFAAEISGDNNIVVEPGNYKLDVEIPGAPFGTVLAEADHVRTTDFVYGYYKTGSLEPVIVGKIPVVVTPNGNGALLPVWDITGRDNCETVWFVYEVETHPIQGDIILGYNDFFVNHLLDHGNANIITGRAWYPNNHAHAFQKLSQKYDGWKTYAKVDLTVEGTQTIKLVAAGAWNLGVFTVTVNGDEVVVDYLMHEDRVTTDIWDDITVDSEYLNIFADEASIDADAESTFAFGVPFSIANDLGGDTEICLVAELVVDYSPNNPYIYREWTGMNP